MARRRKIKFKQTLTCALIISWIIIVILYITREEQLLPEEEKYAELRTDEIENFYKLFAPKPNNKFINHHQYTFTISSNICENNKYYLMILVSSKPNNFHRRTSIRSTYGSVKQYQDKLLTVVFMLGAVDDTDLQRKIFKESEEFGDIVQGNFIDNYRNITMKHIMMMKWLEESCKVHYIMKVDDNAFVNPYHLVGFLSRLPVYGLSVIYCKLISGSAPTRDIRSKWYTPDSLYPFKIFPPFCLDFTYVTIPSVWKTLYKTSIHVSPMQRDDVYVTGVLATIGGVVRVDISKIMYDCSEDLNRFDAQLFQQAVVILDRFNNCGDKSFRIWRDLHSS